jgi:hypothetical protein
MEDKNIEITELVKQYNEYIASQAQEIVVLRTMVTTLKAQLARNESDKVE